MTEFEAAPALPTAERLSLPAPSVPPPAPPADGSVVGTPLSEQSRRGLLIVVVAVVLGLATDALLRVMPWGINVPLWVALVITGALVAAGWRGGRPRSGILLLAVTSLALATGWATRDSFALNALNLLALGLVAGQATLATRSGRLWVAGLLEYGLAQVVTGLSIWFGPFMLAFGDIEWGRLPRQGGARSLLLVGLGLLIALPLLLLFGGLFAAADAVFDRLVGDLFRWLINDLFLHVFFSALAAWAVAGFLRSLLLGRDWLTGGGPSVARPAFLALGAIELTVVLGLLNLLFLAFVLVQLRYLFGGAALVEVSPTLTYAEYARRGFFELVSVAALALPLLLLLDWLKRVESAPQRRLVAGLMAGLLLLLLIVMLSALQRMWLYQAEYGLTELRLYTTAVMIWLGLVCLWFAVTVLPGRRQYFAGGLLVSGLAVVLVLNVLNPDDLIVRTNGARLLVAPTVTPATERGRRADAFDVTYAVSLSADAVPALIDTLADLPARERAHLAGELRRRWGAPPKGDWRSLSWSRWRAHQLVAAHSDELQRWTAPARSAQAPGETLFSESREGE